MNANLKRILSAVLAVLTIGSTMIMAGCSDASDSGNTETTTAADAGETTAAESTEPSRENTPDNLPELNFEGQTLNFFYRNSGNYTKDVVGEAGGDIVADAMYNRNLSVEERLNIKFNLIPGDSNATAYCNHLKTAVLAGSATVSCVMEEMKNASTSINPARTIDGIVFLPKMGLNSTKPLTRAVMYRNNVSSCHSNIASPYDPMSRNSSFV